MRYTDIDDRIERLAANQHGAFSRAQAFDLGASERFVSRRLGEGVWARPVRSTYVLARSSGTWQRQLKVCELSVPGSALSGVTAAALHRLTGARRGPVELWVPATAASRHPLATVHRYAGAARTSVDGFAVTTIAQTVADLAGRWSGWMLERAVDDAILDRRLAVGDLAERAAYYEGSRRPGTTLVAALAAERAADAWLPPESELEARLWRDVLAHVPGDWVRQAPAPWWSRGPQRVDAMSGAHRLIVEADGRRWHARVADFDRDRWRDNVATARGYRVLRFTYLHLTRMVPEVRAVLAETLATSAAA